MNSKGLQINETVAPEKEWIQSSFNLIERFCNEISKEDTEMEWFLNRYFNDEGYVDVWRIPYLLMDIYNGNYTFHSNTLHITEFRRYFKKFFILYYNFCIQSNPLLIHEDDLEMEIHQAIRSKQNCMNAIMNACGRIMQNLEAYARDERG